MTVTEPQLSDLPTGWLIPRGLSSPDEAWTTLGSIDGEPRPIVDRAGMVSPGPGRPSIDWWVAADDRWHVPARESTVRQSLVRGTPVVETAMRVPGGDVLHRCCVVRLPSAEGGGDAVLIEVENRTGIPFALALALRPFDASGRVAVRSVSQAGAALVADARTSLLLQRLPNRVVAGAGADLLDLVLDGEAEGTSFEPLEDPDGLAQVVAIVPVAHKTTYRAVIPLDVDRTEFPSVLPSTSEVAEGWRVQIRDAARAKLPDADRVAALDALVPSLLLAVGQASDGGIAEQLQLAEALDIVGFGDEANEVLARALAELSSLAIDGYPDDDLEVAAVLTLGRHLARGGAPDLAVAAVDVAARAAQRVAGALRPSRFGARRRSAVQVSPDDLHTLALVMDLAGEQLAAHDLAALAEREPSTKGLGDHRDAGEALDQLLAKASSTVRWPGESAWAQTALATSLLADTLVRSGTDWVALAPEVPTSWLGQNFEAHGLHTPRGVVSYAVRWHGDRPALLWEVAGAAAQIAVSAPGLDPTWSSTEASGEALLSPVEVPAANAKPRGAVIGGLQIGRKPGAGSGNES